MLHTFGIVAVSDLEADGRSPPQVSKFDPGFLMCPKLDCGYFLYILNMSWLWLTSLGDSDDTILCSYLGVGGVRQYFVTHVFISVAANI